MLIKFLQKHLFAIFLLASFSTYLLHTVYTKTSVFADARYYFSITRSIVKDRDIDFGNEYAFFGIQMQKGANETPVNFYPPGVSFFWIFGFWMTDGFSNLLNMFSIIDASGFGFLYQLPVAATSIFLGILGLILIKRILFKYYPKSISFLTAFVLFSSTNLLFYIAVEPINSHAVSFFVSALFTYYFLLHQKDKYYFFVLGIISGIAGLVRTQDLALMALPLTQILILNKKSLKSLTSYYLLLIAGVLIGFFPQLLLWKYFYGTFWISPYLEIGFNFLKPHIFEVLFNLQNGLFSITPAILFAVIGLIIDYRKSWIFKYALIYFLLQLFLISSWDAYMQGGSYSIRMIITTYPFLSFSLAKFLEKTKEKIGFRYTLTAVCLFSILNVGLIIRYLITY